MEVLILKQLSGPYHTWTPCRIYAARQELLAAVIQALPIVTLEAAYHIVKFCQEKDKPFCENSLAMR